MRVRTLLLITISVLLNKPLLFGQAKPAAIRQASTLIGVNYNSFSPDYGQGRIQGFGVYGTFTLGNYLGIEGVARRTDLITPRDVGEATYLLGPRLQYRFGRFSPYVKVLGGIGTFRLQLGYNKRSSTSHYGVYAIGGGLDVALSPHVVLRAVDYEAQTWSNFGRNGITPSGFSSGIAYRF